MYSWILVYMYTKWENNTKKETKCKKIRNEI